MSSKDSQHKNKKGQSDKFIEAARELGCDEDEFAFDEIVKKVAKAPQPQKRGKSESKKQT